MLLIFTKSVVKLGGRYVRYLAVSSGLSPRVGSCTPLLKQRSNPSLFDQMHWTRRVRWLLASALHRVHLNLRTEQLSIARSPIALYPYDCSSNSHVDLLDPFHFIALDIPRFSLAVHTWDREQHHHHNFNLPLP